MSREKAELSLEIVGLLFFFLGWGGKSDHTAFVLWQSEGLKFSMTTPKFVFAFQSETKSW